ncbi:NAD-dependent epimerase/dehydratase family protein [Clostridium brassicae]|uniref:NAD-dependent epimerase/dehydratase family protein n=1 Tax=Clostridium brassicae TaxID=2999072 RepID=A0ABT4DB98_9CLOT|nr:NAD-dependent epimerase/dehydratase family protein [Clostridium brassicae]MCY6959578.1 NAD-dependent epimerase/dehydratase family protein [Clostridium brassicae]
MKVLVTGGAGFVGSHIVDLLIQRGYEVVVVDNLYHGNLKNINSRAVFYKVDIRDKYKIKDIFDKEKPDYVIHEASQISVENSIENPILDAEINILGTINVLESCKGSKVKKIIYPASAAIFGEPEYLPIDEKHPLSMLSPYGVSKHTVEHYLDVYNKIYGINYVSLRCSNVYGPRQDSSGEGGVVSIFCNKMFNGERPIIFGDGEQIRDFIYVTDVARATLMAMSGNINGIFNVCSGTKTSINKLVKSINKILDQDIKAINKEERKGDIKFSFMSNVKINSILKWEQKIRLEDGLRNMLKYLEMEKKV